MYILKKPKLDNFNKEDAIKKYIFNNDKEEKEKISNFINYCNNNALYWDKIKYLEIPSNIKAEEFWVILKFDRTMKSIDLPILDFSGEYYSWIKTEKFEKFCHEADMDMGGVTFGQSGNLSESKKMEFISRGIIEEAIASSQLEGASTTRKVAKNMIIQNRKPKNKAEKMILNNYKAIKELEDNYKNKELTIEILFELHKIITEGTLNNKQEEGRFRENTEEINVWNEEKQIIYHTPPDINFVIKEINKLIEFANDRLSTGFTHPIIKAIIIHFWIGYLHPFVDGNGRMARLLFYWYLLRNNYWAFAYLPVSKTIKKSPAQYSMAYVYSEQDELDLTYFINYNIEKIIIAKKEFDSYLDKKFKETKNINKLVKSKYDLNDRQIQLLQFYIGNSEEYTTTKNHMVIARISKMTAMRDLKELEKLGFLYSKKNGKNILYFGTEKIKELSK